MRRPGRRAAGVAAVAVLLAGAPSDARGQEPRVVAVLRFENHTGDAKYDNLGRGLASMMISDLSVLDEIRLVERDRMEALQDELEFQQSAHVDPTTAQATGLMVGAEFVVTGALGQVDESVLLDTRIADVETAEIVKAADVSGPANRLFELQQQLAEVFIDGLGLVLTEEQRARLREQQESNRIDDLDTVLSYSRALCYLDRGAYEQAVEEMADVENAAPRSALVGVTAALLRQRAEDAAKQRLEDEARSRIGGILGRRAPSPRPVRITGC